MEEEFKSILASRDKHNKEKTCKLLKIGLELVTDFPNLPGIYNTTYDPINDIRKALEFCKKLSDTSYILRLLKFEEILKDTTKTYDERYGKFIRELDSDELDHLHSMDDD